MAHATEWFLRVAALPDFVRAFGAIKPATKVLKSGVKLVQREKSVKKQEAVKKADDSKPKKSAEEDGDDEPKE